MAYQGTYGGGGDSSETPCVIAQVPGPLSWSEYEGEDGDIDCLAARRNGWELPTGYPDPRRTNRGA
jgi:hypothetical protein